VAASPRCINRMQIQVVSEYDDFMALQSVWNDVLSKSHSDIVCLTHEWFECWWRSFGMGRNLFILLITENREVIGIAPFCLRRATYRNIANINEIGFCANSVSPRTDFIVVKDKERAVIDLVVEYLLGHCHLWHIFRLQKICTESPTYKILRALLSKMRLPTRITEGNRSPYIHVEGDWGTYFAHRSRKFKSSMRNKLNRVNRFGDAVIERVEKKEDLDRCLAMICDVSSKSWKHDVGKSLPKRPDQMAFYKRITKTLGEKGWIKIWLLKHRDCCIAFEYHLVYKGVVYPIRADFDEEYNAISPGSFLEYNVIKRIFDDAGIQQYDFCGDYYKYMLNWTPLVREYANIAVFNSEFVSRSLGWIECRLIPAIKKGIRLSGGDSKEGKLCRRR